MGLPADGMPGLPVHPSPPSVPDSEPSLAEMIDWIGRQRPTSGTEALRQLRAAFPDSPLTLRVAALSRLVLRRGSDSGPMPR